MGKQLRCAKTGARTEGLDRPPYPGELGKKIFNTIGKKAWGDWLQHQTMLINEYRLTPIEEKDRKFIGAEMEKFFFGEGSQRPTEFKEPK